MMIKTLNNYIDENADFVRVNRSFGYYPELIGSSPKEFVFECQGMQKLPYEITVGWNDQSQLFTDCTCPYDGYGICKHQVAAVNRMVEFVKEKDVTVEKFFKSRGASRIDRSKTTFIPQHKGIINGDELNKIKFDQQGFSYGKTEFLTVEPQLITAINTNYRETYELTFAYSQEKDELGLDCSCWRKMPCHHKLLFLKEFFKRFDRTYFSPHFIENYKEEVLRKNNILGVVEFDEIYELNITNKGIEVYEKVANIVRAGANSVNLFNEDHKNLFVPVIKKKKGSVWNRTLS